MHIQPLFAVTDLEELHQLMRDYPLATTVVTRAGGLEVNLLPLDLSAKGPCGTLSGHVARSHSLWVEGCKECEITVIFQSPNAYISPRWYVNGQSTRRNAPSWNYVAVQACGTLRFVEGAEWMTAHLSTLTAAQEEKRPQPWSTADASPEFRAQMANRLVGFEIEIRDLVGKKFLSQQRTEADRSSLVSNLMLDPSPGSRAIASLIKP
ncbi:MAG TPA: transcriptional regulator [Hydrogenophaga sp.]|uniref:FMN-binding negative transcriptional regulator n=1 Tax=Hydrogenophaga sp. TaxID=1904254 RepID=UPI000CBDC102|nr:FMN-binding negative transcriptional regulator [Hydrogenophaga sp.]PKO64901.1 MAG: transcriptional regulator [Betaproteobacteria bacterium HGW-Betaproteobacteria-16]HAX21967.1 transcriptional regulator [Hydrogenophaga sp.]HBU21207.1 transcriptional regulator [Hydrogenophaga sp.]